jgi:CBS domain-containing protein
MNAESKLNRRGGAMSVRDVMTSEVATVGMGASIKDVGRLLSEREFSGVPVVDRDRRLRGVVTEADIVAMMRPKERGLIARVLRRAPKTESRTAGQAMTSPPITVGPDDPVSRAASLMVEHGINRLPVVVEGRLVGIVSRADLVRSFVRSDGAIAEELEEMLHRRFWLSPGTVAAAVANGQVTLEGELDSRENVELLEWAVGEIPGVIGVRSRLTSRTRNREYRA